MPRSQLNKKMCKAKTRLGDSCFNTALKDSEYCWKHNKKKRGVRDERN